MVFSCAQDSMTEYEEEKAGSDILRIILQVPGSEAPRLITDNEKKINSCKERLHDVQEKMNALVQIQREIDEECRHALFEKESLNRQIHYGHIVCTPNDTIESIRKQVYKLQDVTPVRPFQTAHHEALPDNKRADAAAVDAQDSRDGQSFHERDDPLVHSGNGVLFLLVSL